MDRATELELIRSSLIDARAPAPPMPGEEATLSVQRYLDPARFEAELAWLRRSLNYVAHRSELPQTPGAFLTREVCGAPVLVVRGPGGQARAFLNVCRHRGATLERQASGSCRRFVCPYHAWTYSTEGQLERARHPDAFPSLKGQSMGLTELTLVERGPFLWVCPDPARSPTLSPELAALIDEIGGFDFGPMAAFKTERQAWAANWKLLVEGGLEAYHFKVAHRGTIARLFTDTRARFRFFGANVRGVLPRRSLATLADQPEADWALLPHANVLYTLSPNVSVLVQDGHYAVIRMDPVAPDRSVVELTTVGRPVPEGEAGERRRAFLEENHRFTVRTLKEDFALGAQIQKGLGTGANERLRFGRFEAALPEWSARLDALVGFEPEATEL